ncbi:hypothetical protein BJV74DRAFT_798313 [Russula compacta]|nr:hypothetical protein BJV74DRAFT_798313 [Russula compacta]
MCHWHHFKQSLDADAGGAAATPWPAPVMTPTHGHITGIQQHCHKQLLVRQIPAPAPMMIRWCHCCHQLLYSEEPTIVWVQACKTLLFWDMEHKVHEEMYYNPVELEGQHKLVEAGLFSQGKIEGLESNVKELDIGWPEKWPLSQVNVSGDQDIPEGILDK